MSASGRTVWRCVLLSGSSNRCARSSIREADACRCCSSRRPAQYPRRECLSMRWGRRCSKGSPETGSISSPEPTLACAPHWKSTFAGSRSASGGPESAARCPRSPWEWFIGAVRSAPRRSRCGRSLAWADCLRASTVGFWRAPVPFAPVGRLPAPAGRDRSVVRRDRR